MRLFHLKVLVLFGALISAGCQSTSPTNHISSKPFVFPPDQQTALDNAIEEAIADHRTPGAVLWVEHSGISYHKAYGSRALEPVVEPMTEDTIFDAASLTKVIATTPAIMLLAQRGALQVDAPVQKYIEEFRRDGKDNITIRHLLTHTSGLKAGLSQKPDGAGSAIQIACQEKVTNAPGTFFRYSDINFILLGEIVQRVSGRPLEKFVADEIFLPLKMTDTRYQPWPIDRFRVAPTERDGTNAVLRAVVHDPTARRMGGVAGHAGLFTTATNLARFARMMLNQGELDGVRVFSPETISLMTTVQSSAGVPAKRGLGWDIDSAYSRPRGDIFPVGSYGHTGFTGTSLWIDPYSKTFWILLTNRVHPDGKGNILPLQHLLGTLAAQAAGLEGPPSSVTNRAPSI